MADVNQSVSTEPYACGTVRKYSDKGCRCEKCRERQRADRARRRAAEDREQLRAKWREEKRRQRAARRGAA